MMNVSSLLKELILHACTFPKLHKRNPAERRIVEIIIDQLKAVESIPLQLPHPLDSRAKRVVKTLLAEPGDERTLEKLCEDCGASKRTIQRLFLDETKMTFNKWRQQLRLLHGMQRLAAGEKVTAAALEAGYNSTSAFISMFRKQLGTTPTRYLHGGVDQAQGVKSISPYPRFQCTPLLLGLLSLLRGGCSSGCSGPGGHDGIDARVRDNLA